LLNGHDGSLEACGGRAIENAALGWWECHPAELGEAIEYNL